jgi:hypothetical protein
MIAEANGLSGPDTVVAGQVLNIPNKVHNAHNTADTWRPYDPNEALGDTNPTVAKPPKKNPCGIFGQILLMVISAALTFILPGPGGILGSFLYGAAISTATQGIGVALGIQDHIDWKGVALAGITAGVTAGLGSTGPIAGSKFLGDVVTAGITNAAVQGISIAVGLQKKFDFAGLAGAAIGAGVGGAIGRSFKAPGSPIASLGQRFAINAAAGISNAVARSLVNGSDFGDNLMAALPDVIGQTAGGFFVDALSGNLPVTADRADASDEAAAQEERREEEEAKVRQWKGAQDQPDLVIANAAILSLSQKDRAVELGDLTNPALNVDNDLDQQTNILTMAQSRADAQNMALTGHHLSGGGVAPQAARDAAISQARIIGGDDLATITAHAFEKAHVDDDIIIHVASATNGSSFVNSFAKEVVKYLAPVGVAAGWVNGQIQDHPWASFALEVLDFASGPVTYIGSRILMASPVGKFAEDNIGKAAQWMSGELSSRGFDPGDVGNAILGGVTVGGLAFGAKRALSFFRIAEHSLGFRAGLALRAARVESRVAARAPQVQVVERAAKKFVPNPYGKLGGPAHQRKVAEITADIDSRGLLAEPELRVQTPGGAKGSRYVDVVARDPVTGKVVEYHQVGKQTRNQLPIARETRALDDIEQEVGVRPKFHAYNQ